MLDGFAELQSAENKRVSPMLDAVGVDWLVELAPVGSPSPCMSPARHRLLLDAGGWCWPVRAAFTPLPFADASLPACLVRHLGQPGIPPDVLQDVVRCLKPGGLLAVVSANPWHHAAWRCLGWRSLWLPSWPTLQMRMARLGLATVSGDAAAWRQWLPWGSPLLVIMARKPPGPAEVRQLRYRTPAMARPTLTAGSVCRAA